MKKTAFTIIALVISLSTIAQNLAIRQNFLLDEISYVRDSLNENITNLTFNNNYSWLMTYAQNNYSFFDIPQSLKKRLNQLSQTNSIITSAEMVSDSGWIIVTNYRKIFYKNLPSNIEQALKKVDKRGGMVNFLRIWNPEQFIIFFDNTRFLSVGINKNLYKSINKLLFRGKKIKDIEVAGNSFVILFGKKGVLAYGIPEKLKNRLMKIQQNAFTIDKVRYLPTNQWIIIYNSNEYFLVK